jgi:16S rRNA processing protein RimM
METIPKSHCVKIGFVQKPHGIQGELVIRFQEEFYETLEEIPTLFLDIDNLLVPFFIAEGSLRFKSGESVIARLDWIDSDKKAKELSGLSVYVNQDDIIEPDDELSPNALTGFRLYDTALGFVGEILGMNDFAGNLLLTVEYRGKEALVPLNEDLIIRIDEDAREIEMQLPAGLFDLDED